jgi:GT2 family glycosyltransferase
MELSIIIVNFNDESHLEACLAPLAKKAFPFDYEIIVVDNASTDRSRELVEAKFPEIRWIALQENAGFAKANNRGVQESRGKFLLFLNTDTVCLPDAVRILLERLRTDTSAGAAGPVLFNNPASYQVSFGRRVNFSGQFWQKTVLNPYFRRALKRKPKSRNVGWLSAACLLCRREAFERVGGFDDRFFIYFEDIELCFRMIRAGWKLFFVPQARVFHAGGATTLPRRAESRFEYRKSQAYFYRKHNSRMSSVFLKAYLRLEVARGIARGAFRGEQGAMLREKYRRLLRGDEELR